MRIPPKALVPRQSSEYLAVDDPEVAAALRFIRSHAHRPIAVADVLEELCLSRRTLETRFRKAIGRAPAAEIRRVRVRMAQRILARDDLLLPEVARRCGFPSGKGLGETFKRETGMSPSEYRELLGK